MFYVSHIYSIYVPGTPYIYPIDLRVLVHVWRERDRDVKEMAHTIVGRATPNSVEQASGWTFRWE